MRLSMNEIYFATLSTLLGVGIGNFIGEFLFQKEGAAVRDLWTAIVPLSCGVAWPLVARFRRNGLPSLAEVCIASVVTLLFGLTASTFDSRPVVGLILGLVGAGSFLLSSKLEVRRVSFRQMSQQRNTRTYLALAAEFIGLCVICFLLGSGIGYIQGQFAFRFQWLSDGSSLVHGAASVGGVFAVPVGAFVYYVFLGDVPINLIGKVVFITIVLACPIAFVFGWASGVFTICIAIAASAWVKGPHPCRPE